MIVSILGFGPVGAIMGHIARRQIQERGEQGDGFALAGIIVGWVTTGIWVLCLRRLRARPRRHVRHAPRLSSL